MKNKTPNKKALVLSGGSIKGAFQAGALAELFISAGFVPDAIYGTSVGSLNGAFIADRAGRAKANRCEPDWKDIGRQLKAFWLENITSFDKIGKKRNALALAYSIITKKFVSLLDMTPLYEIIKKEIRANYLKTSPVDFYACAVDMVSGKPVYASAKTRENILEYIIASTAIPFVMPLRKIKSGLYVDGGIREVAPLRQAIQDKAGQIVCVVCQPRKMQTVQFNCTNAVELMNRDMDIVTNETVNNDLDHCREINDILKSLSKKPASGKLKNKRCIDLLEIRPDQPIDLDIESFDSKKIEEAFDQGWNESQKTRRKCPWL